MSRETDSSSSGPQGGGGAAYPSGTPPYGSRQYPSLHPQDEPDDARTPERRPDEPKTETTLTTRIRINIPGSRPIPPVVMRTPMSDTDGAGRADAGAGGDGAAERTGSTPRPPADQEAPLPAASPPAEEKAATSDWFAPRKPAVPAQPPASGPAPGTPSGQESGPEAAPRSSLADLADLAEGAGTPGPPGLPTRPRSGTGAGTGGALRGTGPNPLLAQDGPVVGPAPTPPPGDPFAGATGPAGPTTGPATGELQFAPGDLGQGPSGPAEPSGVFDDTAVLTPQRPAAEPPGGQVSGDTLSSGIPVVPGDRRAPFPPAGRDAGPRGTAPGSGFPQGPGAGFPAGPAAGRPGSAATAPEPEPESRPAPAPARKGRSKLVLAGVGVFGLLAVAYGAGLLLNHSDVPKSTTVLGVDIGGGTREEAVATLDAALGERATAPMQLAVGDQKSELAPDKAGLSLDSQATVRAAAGSDYNPVSVIGSLFGGERVAQPVILVDEEKLSVALADLAGSADSASEGTIRFETGRAVAVPGKPGETVDVARSMVTVKDAYRAQVETGSPNVVTLPLTTREPAVTQAELDRAMKEFAEPAMSGLITIQAGGKQIQFGPARSLPRILSMKAVDGKLVEHYDKAAIEELLEGVFDGIMITKGDGRQYEVSADDVAQAMGPALRGATPAERTAVIELDPS
ncbi:hypothetical protein [Streptomyces sp. C10-9-1]|uniref:hypothetical protein n=1 Tax=Streptomyces sp. C10-9-1 TaxID=1859285 RepID=UPI003D754948